MTDQQIQAVLIPAFLALFFFALRGDPAQYRNGSIIARVGLFILGTSVMAVDFAWFVFDGIVGR